MAMKKNQAALNFIRDLCSAFNKFPILDDTKEFYYRKLSPLTMLQGQWDELLTDLLANSQDGRLPTITDITLASGRVKTRNNTDNYGWCYFKLGGYDYAVRVKSQGGEWINCKTMLPPRIPYNAVDVQFKADKSEERQREDFQKQISDQVGEVSEQMEVPF